MTLESFTKAGKFASRLRGSDGYVTGLALPLDKAAEQMEVAAAKLAAAKMALTVAVIREDLAALAAKATAPAAT